MLPNEDQALQFAIMLQAGLPPHEAILYFVTGEETPDELAYMLKRWKNSRQVKKAMTQLLGKAWHELTLDERCKKGLDQQYSNMAYMLYSESYAEAGPGEKAKLDTARQAIESKLAGTAGKSDALSQFFADINEGRVKLAKPVLKLQ